MNARGETEHYASDIFQSKLGTWFNKDVIAQARFMLANAEQTNGASDSAIAHMAENDLDELEDDERMETPDDDGNTEDVMETWGASTMNNKHTQDAARFQVIGYPQLATHKIQAPELRRTASLPMSTQSRVTQDESHSRPYQPRPQALDLKTAHEEQVRLHTPLGPPGSANPEYRALVIGNAEEVAAFLETRFRQLQQLVCKIVAKAWIKVIEPKKQTRYPYNKGEESRPLWWPASVRHKEPDHLMKPERITLLMTMLRCGKVPTNRLELATAEVAAFIPPDKTNLLREIYRVGREDERFRNREISAETRVYVASTALISSIDDIASPSTGPTSGVTPRTVAEVQLTSQRSTSGSNNASSFDNGEPFSEHQDISQAYGMVPSHQFYYTNPNTDYGHQHAVMSNGHANQNHYHMYTQDNVRRATIPHIPTSYEHAPWPQNASHAPWPDQGAPMQSFMPRPNPPPQIQHPIMSHQSQQPQPVSSQQGLQDFYQIPQAPETPRHQHTEKTHSSPYLPTPMPVQDAQYSAQRAHGVSFSDYLHSPRTSGPEPPDVNGEYSHTQMNEF